MAGHSKWANIQHRKGRQDAKRGKIFTKLSKEILIAGKHDPDPDSNFKLKDAISRAKDANMPNTNIKRLLDKLAGGGEGDNYEEFTYEGYGAHGVAFLVEVATDNRNRTAAEVRNLFKKNGGNLGQDGCVGWLFQKKGMLLYENPDEKEEDILMASIESGAVSLEQESGLATVLTEPTELHQVREGMREQGYVPKESSFTALPDTTVSLEGQAAREVFKLYLALDDHDDVQNVYANFEINEEILEEFVN